MRTSDMRRSAARLLVAAMVAGTLAACADDGEEQGGGDPGAVLDQEFLGHQLREISADGAPTVELEVQPDDHGGWNLRLRTERFTFTPGHTGGEAQAGQGHAHVYVDEEKFSRAYGEWFYLPAEVVGDGEHAVLVTLNADDHTIWAPGGEPLTAEATVNGTDGDAHDHGDGQATPTPPATAAEDVELLEFEISGGQASPPLERITIDQGRTVRIAVTSDQPDEVHLHGYDLSTQIGPGEDGVIEFVADQTGLFELETHETGLVLAQLQVQ